MISTNDIGFALIDMVAYQALKFSLSLFIASIIFIHSLTSKKIIKYKVLKQ